ncbi:MAG: AAA family ATPase [Patescibacteria group bacterium]
MPELLILVVLLLVLIVGWFFYRQINGGSQAFGSMTATLERYSRDLTKLASEKKLDPVVGRQAEITRVIQILSRRTKNNPVLIGKAGIGKTAIVEGLAWSIFQKRVPAALLGKRVLALDLTSILAGTKYRGEFEQRLKRIIEEIVRAQRSIILFIDEIHILAEAGEAEGAINAADILKPLLARGELQVVGATTREEYEQFIKKDKTLDRRLQPIFVSEPTARQTEEIVNGIKGVYEKYHNVLILPQAVTEAIQATKPITNRAYPDKAIDAIDEACSKVRLRVSLGARKSQKSEVKAKDVREVVAEWHSQK